MKPNAPRRKRPIVPPAAKEPTLGQAGFPSYAAFRGRPLLAGQEATVWDACQARLSVQNPRCWAASISKDFRVDIEISAFKALESGLLREVAAIEIRGREVPTILEALQKHTSVDRLLLCKSAPSRLVLLVDEKNCVACGIAACSESVVVTTAYQGRGDSEWTVISADASSLKSLLRMLKEQGCPAEIEAIPLSEGKSEATARQREILSAALEMGYFDDPKRAGLHDLARKFSISRVSVRELLRKAENRVLRRFL